MTLNTNMNVACEDADEKFKPKTKNSSGRFGPKEGQPFSTLGSASVTWCWNMIQESFLNPASRAYQRELVATVDWKQGIMDTILGSGPARVPEIHIRVKINPETGHLTYELVDGQQRICSIMDFIAGKFKLSTMEILKKVRLEGSECDMGGLSYQGLVAKYPNTVEKMIKEYRISCIWYVGINDEATARLFIEVLNNKLELRPQEMRNAYIGALSEWIRNTARGSMKDGILQEDYHSLFARSKVKGKTTLKHFSPTFKLAGHMEIDNWLTSLIYLKINGWEKGLTEKILTKWVKDKCASDWKENFCFEGDMKKLLGFAQKVIESVHPAYKPLLAPVLTLNLVGYADKLKTQYGHLDPSVYTKAFFDVYERWSDVKKKLYSSETMAHNVKRDKAWCEDQMQPFDKMFSGKNKQAISSIFKVLDIEVTKQGIESFGVTEIDKRDFCKEDIYKKWREQGCKDYYTEEELSADDMVGDHYIPRSYGKKKGGVTEYHNLVVTSAYHNMKKLNMHGDEYKKRIRKSA